MSIRVKYRNSVKHWLVTNHFWNTEKAKKWVREHKEEIYEFKEKDWDPFRVAEIIDAVERNK